MSYILSPHTLRWHLFCRVVDNFGDIGFCWRLACSLVNEYQQIVELWVDDLDSFRRINSDIDPDQSRQQSVGVTINQWREPFRHDAGHCTADVVVEVFGCRLPEPYLQLMRGSPSPPLWINLEYLSAETWVNDFHLAPSPVDGMTKYFFMPGFTPQTGGLLWDNGIVQSELAKENESMADFLKKLGIAVPEFSTDVTASLFAYDNPGLEGLLTALSHSARTTCLFVPQAEVFYNIEKWLGIQVGAGQSYRVGSLVLTLLPFLNQADYDQLLALCDLNFVRGEDSFVRAQLMATPLIWQLYPQQDQAHFIKLDAFLALYLEGLPAEVRAIVAAAFDSWNQRPGTSINWVDLMSVLPVLKRHAKAWQQQQKKVGDLALNLVTFCKKRVYSAQFFNTP